MLIYFLILDVFLFNWYVCNADARMDLLAQTHKHTDLIKMITTEFHQRLLAISEFL